MGRPIIPIRTKVHTMIQEGVTDAEKLVAAVDTDATWVRDIIKDELMREEKRRRPGIYCPAAVAYVNSLDSNFKVKT